MGVVEVVAAQADHVAPRDGVARRVGVHHADLRAAGLRVHQLLERNGHEVARLHRDHDPGATGEQVLGRAVAEVPRVVHVGGDGVRAAQLVPDALGHDRRLQPERLEPRADLRLEDLADVDLVDAHVAVRVLLDFVHLGEVGGVDAEHEALGQDGHAVAPAVAEPLDDGAGQRVHHRLEADTPARELLRDEGEGRPRRLADAEGEVSGLAPHGGDEVPA